MRILNELLNSFNYSKRELSRKKIASIGSFSFVCSIFAYRPLSEGTPRRCLRAAHAPPAARRNRRCRVPATVRSAARPHPQASPRRPKRAHGPPGRRLSVRSPPASRPAPGDRKSAQPLPLRSQRSLFRLLLKRHIGSSPNHQTSHGSDNSRQKPLRFTDKHPTGDSLFVTIMTQIVATG